MASTVNNYLISLPINDRRRYIEKLTLIGDECPFSLPPPKWMNDPTEWPEVSYPDIYNYLIESPGIYMASQMKNFKSLEAHKFFTSGWVDVVLHYKPSADMIVFKTQVKPSWRVTDKPHNTWVAAKRTGEVKAAHCDCMAGLGESCSHVGALLFKLEACVRLGYTSVAPTSIACTWNNVCTKKVEADMVKDIKFYTDKAKRKKEVGKKLRPVPKAKEEHQQQFLEMLSATEEMPVCLSTFNGYADPFRPKPWFENLSGFAHEQVQKIEEQTKGQAECSSWHQQRVGRVTGTSAHRVLHTSLEKPSKALLRDIVHKGSVQNRLTAPGIVWGRDHEMEAIETYKYALGLTTTYTAQTSIIISNEVYKAHKSLKILEAGFRVCKDKPYIGVSCDAYISCDCCGKGVVEAKCPLKWASDVLPDQWPADKTGHLDTLLSLRTNHSYYTQVQLQMFVCKTSYADFITWTPRQTVIFRVRQDEDFICEAVDTISRFWAKYIYPQLTGTSVPETELEPQETMESADSAVPDTQQELQELEVESTDSPVPEPQQELREARVE